MKLIDCVQGSDEWKAARLGLATASCFSDILAGGKGVTRAKYRTTLALQRVTGIIQGSFESADTRLGTEREPLACAAYEARKRVWLTVAGFCRHDTLEAGASPDRMIGDDGLLEVKCPAPLAHLAVLRSKAVPSEYVAQVQGEMWICERRRLDFVSWNPDFPEAQQLVVVEVKRDEAYIDRLRAEVAIFLEEVRAEAAEIPRL